MVCPNGMDKVNTILFMELKGMINYFSQVLLRITSS